MILKRKFRTLSARLNFFLQTLIFFVVFAVGMIDLQFSTRREEALAVAGAESRLEVMAMQTEKRLLAVETHVADAALYIKNHYTEAAHIEAVRGIVLSDSDIVGACVAYEPHRSPRGERSAMEYVSRGKDGHVALTHLTDSTYGYLRQEWYVQARDSCHAVWSEPYYDEGAGNMLMTTCAFPIRGTDGALVAVVTADVALSSIERMVNTLRPHPSSRTFVLSREGRYICHWDNDLVMRQDIFTRAEEKADTALRRLGREMTGGEKSYQRMDIDSTDMLCIYTPIAHTGWSVCNVRPYSTITANLRVPMLVTIAVQIVGIILLWLCIRWLVGRETRPLSQFSTVARKIAHGELDEPLPDVSHIGEMAPLHDAMAYLQQSLDRYIADLRESLAKNERIESELSIACAIQRGMLPLTFPAFPERDEIDLHALLTTAREVGGDLYDFRIVREKLHFAVGDVSGKGIPASLVMAVTQSMYRTLSAQTDSPAAIAAAINNVVAENNERNMFVTMLIGVLDLHTGGLTFCNAGHNPPVMMGGETTRFVDVRPNIPVGVIPDFDYQEETLTLGKGDRLVVYTDGITEAENNDEELYSDRRLTALLSSLSPSLSSADVIRAVTDDVRHFAGERPQSDDITMLVLRYIGG
ncbi:MAG: SpoIIE family protein phosphatase [Prevotella sp.]